MCRATRWSGGSWTGRYGCRGVPGGAGWVRTTDDRRQRTEGRPPTRRERPEKNDEALSASPWSSVACRPSSVLPRVHAAFTNLRLRRKAGEAAMMLARWVLALLLAAAGSVVAAEEGCLNPDQRRAAIANRQAIPLGKAVRAAKAQLGGEVVRARLCKE